MRELSKYLKRQVITANITVLLVSLYILAGLCIAAYVLIVQVAKLFQILI